MKISLTRLHDGKQIPFDEMVILYRVKKLKTTNYIEAIKKRIKEEITFYWLTENKESKKNNPKNDGKVKISTNDSSKGLDFQSVFILNVDNMPFALQEDVERAVTLLYIAMTRAQKYLTISYSVVSGFAKYFDHVRGKRLVEIENKKLSS